MQVELFEQFVLDAGADAVAEERAVGHDHAGPAAPVAVVPGRRSLRMMSCRNSRAVSAVCLSSGKLPRMPRSSSPPKGGLVRITSTRSRSPISFSGKRRLLLGVDLRAFQPVQQQVHLPQQVGQRLGLAAEDALLLEDLCGPAPSCTASARWVYVSTRKPPVPQAGSSMVSPSRGSSDFDHEADHGPGRVELAGVAGRVAHLLEHRLVEVAEGVDFLLGE